MRGVGRSRTGRLALRGGRLLQLCSAVQARQTCAPPVPLDESPCDRPAGPPCCPPPLCPPPPAPGNILLIDEIHTPDSSRYWIADTYEQRHGEVRAGGCPAGSVARRRAAAKPCLLLGHMTVRAWVQLWGGGSPAGPSDCKARC